MIKYCWNYIKKYKVNLSLFIILSLLQTILSILIPLIGGWILDIITESKNVQMLLKASIFLITVQVMLLVIQYVVYYQMIVIQTNAAFELNKDLIHHIQKLSLSSIENYDSGYLSQRINSDSNTVILFSVNSLVNFPCNILVVIVTICVLLRINHLIGGILLAIVIGYIALYVGFKERIYQATFAMKEEQNKFFSILLKQLGKVRFLKIQSLYQEFDKSLDENYKTFFSCVKNNQLFLYIYRSLYASIVALAQVGIYLGGGIQVISGIISLGSLTIMISLFQKALNSATYFSDFVKQYQDSQTSFERIKEIMELSKQTNGKIIFESLEEISCDNITLLRNRHKVINNFSYYFQKGNIYGIMGENGSGKTSLIELLVGIFNDEFDGELKINGIRFDKIDFEQLRLKNISFLEQKPELNSKFIDENIFLTEYHRKERLRELLEKIKYSEVLFNWEVGLEVSGLSGGEIQKLALYRTLSKNANAYFFDEGNSALDENNKKLFANVLEFLKKDSIVFVISHEKKLIEMCDYIINMDEYK